MKKKDLKNQKGAISIFVLMAMLFFLVTMLGVYTITSKRAQTQTESVELVKEKYYTGRRTSTLSAKSFKCYNQSSDLYKRTIVVSWNRKKSRNGRNGLYICGGSDV